MENPKIVCIGGGTGQALLLKGLKRFTNNITAIVTVTDSGRSTGPHLHYEIKYASTLLNPNHFLNWNLANYESVFKKERRVEWESLISLIKDQHQMGQQ
jgi:hypothetical protein